MKTYNSHADDQQHLDEIDTSAENFEDFKCIIAQIESGIALTYDQMYDLEETCSLEQLMNVVYYMNLHLKHK